MCGFTFVGVSSFVYIVGANLCYAIFPFIYLYIALLLSFFGGYLMNYFVSVQVVCSRCGIQRIER